MWSNGFMVMRSVVFFEKFSEKPGRRSGGAGWQ
jgi:hypothetical protein